MKERLKIKANQVCFTQLAQLHRLIQRAEGSASIVLGNPRQPDIPRPVPPDELASGAGLQAPVQSEGQHCKHTATLVSSLGAH